MAVTNEPALRDPSWSTPQEQYLARQRNNDQFLEIVNSLGSFSEGEFESLEDVVTALVEQVPTIGTPQTTAGTETFVDFTDIPSWVTRITISLVAVSTNGTAVSRLRLGASGGLATSGYNGSSSSYSATASTFTAGFDGINASASAVRRGAYHLTKVSSSANIWSCTFSLGRSDTGAGEHGAGEVTLSGDLTQIRWTTSNGTDTIDANGIFNIFYM
jgi:hypothetical protein